jgi:hypothetical protein
LEFFNYLVLPTAIFFQAPHHPICAILKASALLPALKVPVVTIILALRLSREGWLNCQKKDTRCHKN